MNTHTFDAVKTETHDLELIMGQNLTFESMINNTNQFYLILDEFQESDSLTVKILEPVLIKIIELKEKLFPTVITRVQNRISLTPSLKSVENVYIKTLNRITASISFYQHEDVFLKTQVKFNAFMRTISKVNDVNIIIANRMTATPTMKRVRFLSEFDPELLSDLDSTLLQDMDYEIL